MSRVGTTYLNLGTYEQNEHPGAGSQSVDNDNLNGNWKKIDTAVGAAHNADGSHKAAVIHSDDLNSDVADGSTLEQDGSTKKLKIKADGITGAQIGDDIIGKEHIKPDVAGSGLDQDSDGSLKVHVDGATIAIVTDALTVQKNALPFDLIVFGSQSYAGPAATNTPTALTWIETGSTAYVAKIYAKFTGKTHMKYLKLYAFAKTFNATYAWNVRLTLYDGGLITNYVNDTDSGVNTSYLDNSTPNCIVSIDISSYIVAGDMYTAVIELQGTHVGGDFTLQDVVVVVTSA